LFRKDNYGEMMNEQQIQDEIKKMRAKGRSIAEIANRFGKSYRWAYDRINLDYLSPRIRSQLNDVCDPKFRMDFVTSEKTGNSYCTRCKRTVNGSHFKV
jgi:hypothetical protein